MRINDPKCVTKTFPEYALRPSRHRPPVPVVAIDGPSASGQGTKARVAAALELTIRQRRVVPHRRAGGPAQGVALDDEVGAVAALASALPRASRATGCCSTA